MGKKEKPWSWPWTQRYTDSESVHDRGVGHRSFSDNELA